MNTRQRLIELRSFDNRWLKGILSIPTSPAGGVLLVDGTAAGRLNDFLGVVATGLAEKRLIAMVVDVLTDDESSIVDKRLDIELLSSRVQAAADGLSRELKLPGVRLGYFGLGVGAAAVLVAAAQRKSLVGAVVCVDPNTQLAENYRARVRAPVLTLETKKTADAKTIAEKSSEWFLANTKTVDTGII